jgi:hypothetical protein
MYLETSIRRESELSSVPARRPASPTLDCLLTELQFRVLSMHPLSMEYPQRQDLASVCLPMVRLLSAHPQEVHLDQPDQPRCLPSVLLLLPSPTGLQDLSLLQFHQRPRQVPPVHLKRPSCWDPRDQLLER